MLRKIRVCRCENQNNMALCNNSEEYAYNQNKTSC